MSKVSHLRLLVLPAAMTDSLLHIFTWQAAVKEVLACQARAVIVPGVPLHAAECSGFNDGDTAASSGGTHDATRPLASSLSHASLPGGVIEVKRGETKNDCMHKG